ncbi:hypothetical protein F5Y11DRAFT_321984 [Daldinia sp. FL1419]|nr:hypothetical protein F5Y11DRAFT_321984 [Daldinia sp. FL1419]
MREVHTFFFVLVRLSTQQLNANSSTWPPRVIVQTSSPPVCSEMLFVIFYVNQSQLLGSSSNVPTAVTHDAVTVQTNIEAASSVS